ncbi:hypothetical protein [Swingsia samuiensis]|uniref:Uncharacterized protein n=1 Tax=Swingsia samuiensis TaxID=1293412 RepID=A0A4Y6UKB2_9PROT|nr:hypothetical protein [Swingsia samuiensis]QDH17230.1 hypothetical protein E3D00_06405 [Swingsia samuiensis]
MSLDLNADRNAKIIDELQIPHDHGDRHGYYTVLKRHADPYGNLALGVVDANAFAGLVAIYFIKGASLYYLNKTLSDDLWLKISIQLMKADFSARRALRIYDRITYLYWITVRDYHQATFEYAGIPRLGWTAYIPLEIVGPSKGADLWNKMLKHGIVLSSFHTVVDVLKPVYDQFARINAQLSKPPLEGMPSIPNNLTEDAALVLILTDIATHISGYKDDLLKIKGLCSTRETKHAYDWLWIMIVHATIPASTISVGKTISTNWRGTKHTILHLFHLVDACWKSSTTISALS